MTSLIDNTYKLPYKAIPRDKIKSTSSLDSIEHNLTRRLGECGETTAKFYCEGCGNTKEFTQYCWIRICRKCVNRRSLRLFKQFRQYLSHFRQPKLLTLTFKGSSEFTKAFKKDCDLKIRNFFRRLRRYFRFGIRALELKKRADGYYVHYHVLLEGFYVPQARLSQIWLEVTKTSFILDIRRVNGNYGLNYVLKYATKPVDFEIPIKEYAENFYKTRLVTAFGEIYAIQNKISVGLVCEKCNGIMRFLPSNDYTETYLTMLSDINSVDLNEKLKSYIT